eukprot:3440071-Amphidinium_carterae.1
MGARLLSCSTLGSVVQISGVVGCCPGCGAKPLVRGVEGCSTREYEFGAYRTPAEWHQLAILLPFPMDVIPFLRPWQGMALFNLLSKSPSEVTKLRADTLRRVCALKKDLQEKERILRSSMPSHVEHV